MKKHTYILNLETATKNCSVSLSKNGILIGIKEFNDGNYSHAELLNPFIAEVLKMADISFSDLSAIAISKGPGSYTGLRIGVSTAKGLCFALDIPLISVDTLAILAQSIQVESGVIIPLLDARRMEVYQAVFDVNHQFLLPTEAVIVDENTYDYWFEKSKVHFVGDAVTKIKTVLNHPNAIFYEDIFPSSSQMCAPAFQKFIKNDFENVAYFEPFYLKDFIVLKKL